MTYLARRLWQFVPTLLGVVLLVFFLFNWVGGDPAQVLVRQVPSVVGDAPDAGVGRDDGPRRHGQDVVDRRERGVRHVEDHPARLHAKDHLVPHGREPTLGDSVGRSAECVVEEVARRHHPEAGIEHDLDVGRVVIERMRTFDGQEPRRDRPGRRPPGEMCVEIRLRTHDRQPAC